MKITLVAGARPNFMKIAPIIHALKKAKELGKSIEYRLVHTGQHYDKKLSSAFFEDLKIPEPDINLEVGSGSHAQQTANIMIKFEKELSKNPADYILVVGDVNSTLACSIVAKKMNAKVIHVEAGLRSYDLDMPEEINRMVTDALADVFFTTTPEAGYNLVEQGCKKLSIFFVGNTMIDSLIANLDRLQKPALYNELGLQEKNYLVMTLHRPSNVDEEEKLAALLKVINDNAKHRKVIFPVHPRTKTNLQKLNSNYDNIHMIDPLGYLEFMFLVKNAFAVITDSGGIQEETTFLKIPCITLRENTERPETIFIGTNELCGYDENRINDAFQKLNEGEWKHGNIPELWDGKTGERIVETILKLNVRNLST